MVLTPMVPRGVPAGVAASTPAAECTPSKDHRQRFFRPNNPRPLRRGPGGTVTNSNLAQLVWRFFEWEVGAVSIAIPLGGSIGLVLGAVVGWITRPALLVLLSAVFFWLG